MKRVDYGTKIVDFLEKYGKMIIDTKRKWRYEKMALIQCPECGQTISDRATTCPHCAFPIADSSPSGVVRIKMSAVKASTGWGGKQQVTLLADGKELWKGNTGQIAEVHFDEATFVSVKYHLSAMHYGGECSGMIDPVAGKKYNVQARQGMFKTVLELQRVDYIDSD